MIPSQAVRWLSPVLLLTLALTAAAKEHVPPAVEPATRFAAVETHTNEGVSVAAEPYETREKCAIFRVDYLRRGILPVRLLVTNNSDRPIALREARIFFESASGDSMRGADPEEIEQHFSLKNRIGAKAPSPTAQSKPTPRGKLIEQDYDDFEFSAQTIAPHTTRAGFLFYIVENPVGALHGAHQVVREILDADGNALYAFEIPFDRYLRSKSGQMD